MMPSGVSPTDWSLVNRFVPDVCRSEDVPSAVRFSVLWMGVVLPEKVKRGAERLASLNFLVILLVSVVA